MQSWHGSVEESVKYEPIKNKSTRTQPAQGYAKKNVRQDNNLTTYY